jgi:hypothetical protein
VEWTPRQAVKFEACVTWNKYHALVSRDGFVWITNFMKVSHSDVLPRFSQEPSLPYTAGTWPQTSQMQCIRTPHLQRAPALWSDSPFLSFFSLLLQFAVRLPVPYPQEHCSCPSTCGLAMGQSQAQSP